MLSLVARGLALLISAGALSAQAPADPPRVAGFETSWAIAPVFAEISGHAERLAAALDKIDGKVWVRKGASETYAVQLESSRQQARALAAEAKALAANPDKLPAALVVLFRMQGLDAMLPSLEEAMRKYQSPADAVALVSLAVESGISRERVQHYIVNLASEREEDMRVMDKEAQRCRALVTQSSPPVASRKR